MVITTDYRWENSEDQAVCTGEATDTSGNVLATVRLHVEGCRLEDLQAMYSDMQGLGERAAEMARARALQDAKSMADERRPSDL